MTVAMDGRSRTTLIAASVAGAALIHIVLAACGGDSTPGAQAQEDGASTATAPGSALPAGIVMAFAGAQPPAGWLLCDGRPVSRTEYAALFAVIGIADGSGDGATTFNLPDYRGRFLRGVDGSAGHDPDAAKRTAPSPGANVGDAVGSLEGSAFAQHQHGLVDPGHGHGVSDPGHAHGVNDPGHGHGVTDPGHIHQACFGEETETTVEPVGTFGRTADWWENYDGCTNNVVQSARTGITINGSLTGISLQSATTGIGVQSATTGVSELPAGSSSETRPVNVAVYWIIKT
jgi:microcystin-dependent protein